MVDEAGSPDWLPVMESLLECIEHEAGLGRARHPPADNAPGVGIDHEGDVHKARPGRDIGEVADPKRIRPRRPELPVDPIERARRGPVADRGPHRLAADGTLQAMAFISRTTVQRATAMPSRASWRRASSRLARRGSFSGSARRAIWA